MEPKFTPGQVMRYQVEFRTTSDTKRGGTVEDPEGPSHVVITWNAKVRLEVLDAGATGNGNGAPSAQAAGSVPALRLRTTYEQSTATVQSDSPDPQADAIVKQYRQLDGHSLEFALASDGRIVSVTGLAGIVTDEKTVNAAQQWMSELSAGAAPSTVAPGITWSTEQPADSLPLAGLAWRTDSTYLRDDSCGAALPAESAPAVRGDSCAVILMSLTLQPSHSKEATPDVFRRNGLQSSGKWSGSGDSLSYVSLRTGWVVSASQNSTQNMDVSITSALGAAVHYAGTVQTHSQIVLLPPDSPAAPTPPQESSSKSPPASSSH